MTHRNSLPQWSLGVALSAERNEKCIRKNRKGNWVKAARGSRKEESRAVFAVVESMMGRNRPWRLGTIGVEGKRAAGIVNRKLERATCPSSRIRGRGPCISWHGPILLQELAEFRSRLTRAADRWCLFSIFIKNVERRRGEKERSVISKLCYPSNFFCARPVVDTKHHPLWKLIFLKKPAGRCFEEGDCFSLASNDTSLLFSICLLSLILSFVRRTIRNKINV